MRFGNLWFICFSVILSPTLRSFLSYMRGQYLPKAWDETCADLQSPIVTCSSFSLVCFSGILAALVSPNVFLFPQLSETARLCFPHDSKLYQQSCVDRLKKVSTGGKKPHVRMWQRIRLSVILRFRRWWYRNYMDKCMLHTENCFRVWCGAVVGLTSFFPLFFRDPTPVLTVV